MSPRRRKSTKAKISMFLLRRCCRKKNKDDDLEAATRSKLLPMQPAPVAPVPAPLVTPPKAKSPKQQFKTPSSAHPSHGPAEVWEDSSWGAEPEEHAEPPSSAPPRVTLPPPVSLPPPRSYASSGPQTPSVASSGLSLARPSASRAPVVVASPPTPVTEEPSVDYFGDMGLKVIFVHVSAFLSFMIS